MDISQRPIRGKFSSGSTNDYGGSPWVGWLIDILRSVRLGAASTRAAIMRLVHEKGSIPVFSVPDGSQGLNSLQY
jgi:DNA-binding transcriptional regulator PaaX